jgi:hypothetical protein
LLLSQAAQSDSGEAISAGLAPLPFRYSWNGISIAPAYGSSRMRLTVLIARLQFALLLNGVSSHLEKAGRMRQ